MLELYYYFVLVMQKIGTNVAHKLLLIADNLDTCETIRIPCMKPNRNIYKGVIALWNYFRLS